ncbi:MAG TPA: hypothetical protein EYG92_11530 [Lutibacter sp.]|nr:hypothetical protein [Lutibacter sp.]
MKNIKTMYKYLLIFIVLSTTSSVFAQKNKRFEKIKAHKVAYITDKLELSSQEAEKFWPVYNKYEKDLHQLEIMDRKELVRNIVSKGGVKSLSEQEAQAKLNELELMQDAIFTKRKEKFKEIQKTISAKKVLLLYRVEKDFKKELLKRLQQKRGGKF